MVDGLLITGVVYLVLGLLGREFDADWRNHALMAFLLVRDLAGGSPGKRLLGLAITSPGGGPVGWMPRLVRNTPLVLAFFLSSFEFPLSVAGPLVFGLDTIPLLVTGQRSGDRLAGTRVARPPVSEEVVR
jgi:uncharacterized RDD family membrane protein YckC